MRISLKCVAQFMLMKIDYKMVCWCSAERQQAVLCKHREIGMGKVLKIH